MHGFSPPCFFSFFPSASNAKEQPGGDSDTGRLSITAGPSRKDVSPPPPSGCCGEPGFGVALWHFRGEGRRWVAPRGPMHSLGRLCIHIHLYEWATGKCKPKVIAPDKNICSVNKYSNEASTQVPQTDAELTGLRRDRR